MITWPVAIAIVGGIASVCLTVLKIISIRKQDNGNKEQAQQIHDVRERLAILETKFDDNQKSYDKTMSELKLYMNKLSDLVLEVLKKIKMNGN